MKFIIKNEKEIKQVPKSTIYGLIPILLLRSLEGCLKSVFDRGINFGPVRCQPETRFYVWAGPINCWPKNPGLNIGLARWVSFPFFFSSFIFEHSSIVQ